jgi:hypothetical protein
MRRHRRLAQPGAGQFGRSDEPSQAVEHERSGDCDVQAGASADHRNLHGAIEQLQRPGAGCRPARGRAPSRCVPERPADQPVGSPRRPAPAQRSRGPNPAGELASRSGRRPPRHAVRRRNELPRASASGTHGSRGTIRQAPTASQVRSNVPRFAPCSGLCGSITSARQVGASVRRRDGIR